MHRKLCTLEWQDQVEGIKFLRKLPYVARERIGIWGWSYGGTAAVTCLLKAPDYFQAAAAVAPVLDWRNYDAIYTEHFMDTPSENPGGYREADLTAFAGDLEGSLLLVHGRPLRSRGKEQLAELHGALIHRGDEVHGRALESAAGAPVSRPAPPGPGSRSTGGR